MNESDRQLLATFQTQLNETRADLKDTQNQVGAIMAKLTNGITDKLDTLVVSFAKHEADHEAGAKRAQEHERWLKEFMLKKRRFYVYATGTIAGLVVAAFKILR